MPCSVLKVCIVHITYATQTNLTYAQGYNARKVISEMYASFVLQCSVLSLGGNVNTRRMSQPDMGSIFHIKNQ